MVSTNGRALGVPARATDIRALRLDHHGYHPQNSSFLYQSRHPANQIPSGDVWTRLLIPPHLMVPASPYPQPRHVSNLALSFPPCPPRVAPRRLTPP